MNSRTITHPDGRTQEVTVGMTLKDGGRVLSVDAGGSRKGIAIQHADGSIMVYMNDDPRLLARLRPSLPKPALVEAWASVRADGSVWVCRKRGPAAADVNSIVGSRLAYLAELPGVAGPEDRDRLLAAMRALMTTWLRFGGFSEVGDKIDALRPFIGEE